MNDEKGALIYCHETEIWNLFFLQSASVTAFIKSKSIFNGRGRTFPLPDSIRDAYLDKSQRDGWLADA